eukprot:jgi/Psemu1/302212/fgenesh1_kg.62_\
MAIHSKISDHEGPSVGQPLEKGTRDLESKKTTIVSDCDSNSYRDYGRDRNDAPNERAGRTANTKLQASPSRTNHKMRNTTTTTPNPNSTTTQRRRKRKELSSRNSFFVDRHHQMLVTFGPSYKEFVSQAPPRKSSPTKAKKNSVWKRFSYPRKDTRNHSTVCRQI